jgi:hypothetical protein
LPSFWWCWLNQKLERVSAAWKSKIAAAAKARWAKAKAQGKNTL